VTGRGKAAVHGRPNSAAARKEAAGRADRNRRNERKMTETWDRGMKNSSGSDRPNQQWELAAGRGKKTGAQPLITWFLR